MAKKSITKKDSSVGIENTTDTELQILQNIEKAFFRNNPRSAKRNTNKSLEWFRKYVPKNYHKVRIPQMFRDSKMWYDKPVVGNMYFFHYDAIHKDTLPVWDRYPLIFPFDIFRNEKNGELYMLGINLHYLPPRLRYQAMRALLTLRNEKRYRKNTKLKISWQVLKGLAQHKLFEHAVKMYKMDHVQSRFAKIPPRSWELALFLPLARWEGNKAEAWKI